MQANRGKKFDAHEKHFKKLEQEYINRVKGLEQENFKLRQNCDEKSKECIESNKKIGKLEKENKELEKVINGLKEMLPLTADELDETIKNIKSEVDCKNAINVIAHVLGSRIM